MNTRIDAISSNIHRISTFVPEGPPGGITFNQFLLVADEPMLFHTGTRRLFPAVRAAVAQVMDPARIRWISSNHASRPDEYGALAEWQATAPRADVVHGRTGCFLCLGDVAARPPRPLVDGEAIDLGGLCLRWFETPHVPGPWETGVLFEETSSTLFSGDLFSRTGEAEVTTTSDIVEASIAHDRLMHGHAVTPLTGPTLRRLAKLGPRAVALMHGPSFLGDGAIPLTGLAEYFEMVLKTPVAEASH